MKRSIKKIALSLLLALGAIVLCVFGNSFLNGKNTITADAASTPTVVTITADKTSIEPGDTITISGTVTTTLSGTWSAFGFNIAPLSESGEKLTGDAAVNQYFEFCMADEWTYDYEFGSDFTEDSYSFIVRDDFSQSAGAAYIGFGPQLGATLVSTSTNFTFKLKIKYKSDAPEKLGNLKFGIAPIVGNYVTIVDGSTSTKHTANQETRVNNKKQSGVGDCMTINLASIMVGAANASLSNIKVGHVTASTAVTIPSTAGTNIEMVYNDDGTGNDNRTNFKVIPTVSDATSTIKYGVGASSSATTNIANNGTISIPTLDSSGETIVKFLVTAAGGAATQNYTLKIVSGYARLKTLTVTTAPTYTGMGLTAANFNQNTFEYTVKVPSDYTSVDVGAAVADNYGIGTDISVAATGCTAANKVTSGGSISVSSITNNATLEFTATAKSGNTQKYKITFNVLDTDTSISSLTMTEKTTNKTVTNDSTKAPSGGYYFLLSEDSGFQGTFNLTLGSANASAKVDGADFSASTMRSAKTYTFVVTAQAGNTKTYSVVVAKDLQAGTVKDLKYAFKTNSNHQDVSTITDMSYDADTNTYTYNLTYDPSIYGATGNTFYLKGTASEGATISVTGGLTTITGGWSKAISQGKNEFSLTANTPGVGSTTYKFVVTLAEGKNTITNVTIAKGSDNVGGFTFSPGQYVYNITVPYQGYDNVTFTVTTDGTYTSVVREPSTTFAHTAGTTTHTLTNVALTAGSTTTVVIHAQADGTSGDVGSPYTFNIQREVANSNATLSSLSLTVDGTPVGFLDSAYDNDVNFTSGNLTYYVALEKPDTATSAALVFTATATASTSSLTCGISNFTAMTNGVSNQSFTFTAGTENTTVYTIKVTAQDGSSNSYTVTVKHVIPDPVFTDLQISFKDTNNYYSVLDSSDYDANTGTYTITQKTDDVPVNSYVYLKGAVSKEASVQKGTSLVGTSTTTGPWNGSLAFGKNEYSLTVKAGSKTKVYKIVVNLIEDKRGIEDVKITLPNGTAVEELQEVPFSFDSNSVNTTYDITVPYLGYGTVKMTVTTEGKYTVVFDGTNKKFTHTAGADFTHTFDIPLEAGKTKTVIIHSVADNDLYTKEDPSKIGPLYTFNITREAADDNNKLKELEVTIDGEVISFNEALDLNNTFTYNHTIKNTGNATASIVISATTDSEKAKIKIDSDTQVVNTATSTKTFTFGTTAKTESYKIVVTPEAGAAQTYTINIKRELAKGDFDDVETSLDNSSFLSVMTDFEASGTNAKTYSFTYNVEDVAVGSKIYVRVTANADSKATPGTGVTLDNSEGNVYVYAYTLSKFGDNNFKITASSSATSKTEYNFNIKLTEDIDDLSNVTISNGTAELDKSDYDFDAFTDTYDISVRNAVSSVTFDITPEGKYTYVYRDGTRLTSKKGDAYEVKVTLKGGETTTVVIYGVANEGKGKSDGSAKGREYTFNITRENADPSTTLKELVVKIGGKEMPINFDPENNDYVVEIEKPENETSTVVEFTATPSSDTSKIGGKTGTSTITNTFAFVGNSSHSTDYKIEVVAESGAKGTYTVTVKRVVIAGDFETLEFAETGNNYVDVRSSSRYDEVEMTYTVDLKLSEVSAGTNVRIKAIPTSGAKVTTVGNIKDTSIANVYSATVAAGRNEYKLKASSGEGEKEYIFVINLFEEKNTIENVVITADGKNLTQDVFKFEAGKTSYDITVPYTVKSVKMTVTTDGMYTEVFDYLDNKFEKAPGGNGRNHERTIDLPEGVATSIYFHAKSDKGEISEEYEIRISRESANSDVALKSLVVMIGNRAVAFNEGSFDPDRLDYTILVDESPSYNVEIKAEPNVTTSTVAGIGKFTFNLSDSTSTMNYPITVTAEDGSTRTYNVTISQKPVVIDENYDIRRIVINGTRDYYDDVPSEYNNEPVKITVPASQNRVKVVVTTASVKSSVVTNPSLSANGYLDLPEDSTTTLIVYAVAENGANVDGRDCFIFEITREKQGEKSGPDARITWSNKYDIEPDYIDIDIDTEEALVKVVDTYNHEIDRVEMIVDLFYGGDFEILRVDSQNSNTIVPRTISGRSANVKLDYGTNVFNITMYSSDGYSKKTVIFVFSRERASLLGLSASGIATLKDDFDPAKDDYSYNVSSNVDYLGLVVDIDKAMYRYEFKGSEQLNYGANQVVIEIYDNISGAMGRAAVNEAPVPVRTITLNITRERSNLFWIIMFVVLVVLVIAELIIILLVRRNKNGGHEEPAIIVTAPPAPQALPSPQPAQQIQPIIIQAPPPQQVQMPPQQAQLPQPGQTTVYITPQDPNNPQY